MPGQYRIEHLTHEALAGLGQLGDRLDLLLPLAARFAQRAQVAPHTRDAAGAVAQLEALSYVPGRLFIALAT